LRGLALGLRAWPALGKVLLQYALAARVPVILVMLVAMLGNWGTHYDVAPPNFPEMGTLAKWFAIGVVPQLSIWIWYTVVVGMIFGSRPPRSRDAGRPRPERIDGGPSGAGTSRLYTPARGQHSAAVLQPGGVGTDPSRGRSAVAVADKKLDEAVAKAEAQLAKGKDDEAGQDPPEGGGAGLARPEAPLALASLWHGSGGWTTRASPSPGRASSAQPRRRPCARACSRRARPSSCARARPATRFTLAKQSVDARAGADELAALARAQARLGDPAARATADKAVQAAATSAPAQLARGDALLAARLAKDAEAAYQRALELSPKWAPAGTGLALALAAQGKGARAIEAARAASRPTRAPARRTPRSASARSGRIRRTRATRPSPRPSRRASSSRRTRS
jgi:hypothetical protein